MTAATTGATTDRPADFAAVLAAERERIAHHRARRGVSDQPVVGVALSGGGIRSASFGLGVLQALAARGRFRAVDYLSTVSGGGYAGTALTWWRRLGMSSCSICIIIGNASFRGGSSATWWRVPTIWRTAPGPRAATVMSARRGGHWRFRWRQTVECRPPRWT